MTTPTAAPGAPAAPDPLLLDLPERLDTAQLILRRPRAGDGAALHAAVSASLEDLRPWMPWAQMAQPPEQAELTVRRMSAQYASREDLTLLMIGRDEHGGEGLLLGACGLHRIDWAVPRFEIGYWRRSGFGGLGLAAEAAAALTRLAFDRLGARRVEIRMDARNAGSRRVAERAGYALEGVLRQHSLDMQGLPCDTCVYARVRGVEEP